MTLPTKPAPPRSAEELLARLRRFRLLDGEQWRRLSAGWPGDLSAADAAARLVQAGLLTAYQAEEARAGQARRLRLGPYRLLDRLGTGGSGDVFKAEHVLMRRLVTLKVFRGKAGARPRAEVLTAAGLSHPNLVTALDATHQRGRLILVLEYVDGVDLDAVLFQAGRLPIDLASEVIRQAARALAYLHRKGLIHRDIKPANLLLTHDGADAKPTVKLIDLGLVCPAGMEGELCGTVDYMAPERGLGEPIDARSDLYSLGCTAYHLLTGQAPFPGGTWTSKLLRHRMESPVPILTLRPDVPLHLVAIVNRLMSLLPTDRYPDADALLAVLDAPAGIPVRSGQRSAVSGQPERVPLAMAVRKRYSWSGAMGRIAAAAAFLGVCVGGAARLSVPEASAIRASGPGEGAAIAGREEPFLDLHRAIQEAPDGGAITLPGPGPYRLAPLARGGKSLTIQSAPGVRSRIERADAPDATWDALLSSEKDLTLVGLDVVGGTGDQVAPLVSVTGGRLTLTNCTLKAQTSGPLVALRQGGELRLERTRLDATAQGIAVEVGRGRRTTVSLTDTTIRVRDAAGAGLLVWSAELVSASPVTVEMRRSEIDAGRVVALRALDGQARINATSCRFTFHQALASLDACRDKDWRKHLNWQGRDNARTAGGAFLRQDGESVAWDEEQWRLLASGRP